MPTCELTIDSTTFTAALAEASSLVEHSLELRNFLLSRIDSPAELCRFRQQQPATGATVTVLLEPTDGFRDALAAARAGNL